MPSTILSDNGVSSGSAGLKTTAASDGSLALQTTTAGGTATTAVTIDTSQNVGVGVTPSAWTSTRAIEFSYGAFGASSGLATFATSNANYNSGWKYTNTGTAGLYNIVGNSHQWFNAGSGTAGNAISFTQAMTLDSSGNLLVGTTSVGTMSGNVVQRLVNTGIIPRTSTSLANNGTLNIVVSSGGASFTGFLIVESVLLSNANVRTQTTYSVFGRGTSLTATSIATVNGPSGGRTFTITAPSAGVISFTNTSGDTVGVNMTFFGSEGF